MPHEGTAAYTPDPATPGPATPTIRYRSDGPAPQALGGLGSLVTAATGFFTGKALQAKPGSRLPVPSWAVSYISYEVSHEDRWAAKNITGQEHQRGCTESASNIYFFSRARGHCTHVWFLIKPQET